MQLQLQPKAAKPVSVQQMYATMIHGGEPEVSESGCQSPRTQSGSLASDKSSERKYSIVVYGIVASFPGSRGGGGLAGQYTLLAHAQFPQEFCGLENRGYHAAISFRLRSYYHPLH